MKSPFHIMEDAWVLYTSHYKQLLIIPFVMLILSLIPSIAFPWAVLPGNIAPSPQLKAVFFVTQIVMYILYQYFMYAFIFEAWRIMKKSKQSFEQNMIEAFARFPHTFATHILLTLIITIGAAGYIILTWLLSASSEISGQPMLSWPLLLGIPLIFPALFLATRYIAAPLFTLFEKTSIKESFEKSKQLTKDRWWQTFIRLFVPMVLWSVLNAILLIVFIIITLLLFSMNPFELYLGHSYAIIIITSILESLFLMPLATLSTLILFAELKQTK